MPPQFMKNEIKKIRVGLKKLPKDRRDFKLSGVFARFPLENLPEQFIVGQTEVLDQRESDFCTGYATCYASSIQEGITLEPSFSFAVSKMISGDKDSYGQDLRTACKGHVLYGALASKDSPFSLQNKDIGFLRDFNNWPSELFALAKDYKKQSYFSVDGPYDHFDNCRVAMFLNQDKKRFIITGCLWRTSWTGADKGIIPQTYENDGGGHAFVFTGWVKFGDKTYIKAQLSNGDKIGLNGNFFFPREVVNKEFTFGSYLFVDLDPENVKKQQWNFWTKLLNYIKKLWH